MKTSNCTILTISTLLMAFGCSTDQALTKSESSKPVVATKQNVTSVVEASKLERHSSDDDAAKPKVTKAGLAQCQSSGQSTKEVLPEGMSCAEEASQ